MKLVFFLIPFLISLSSYSNPSIGGLAPNFTLKGHDGKSYSLSSYKGKYVILEWFNNECPYVDKHYATNNMQKLQKKFNGQTINFKNKKGNDKQIVWLSIVSSAKGKQGYVTSSTAKEVIDNRKASMTAILLDPDGKVGKLYDAKTTPHMFIINPEGMISYMGAIDDQPSIDKKTVKVASNYITRSMASISAGNTIDPSSTKPYGCSVKY